MGSCCSRRNDAPKSAFVKCSVLRWILGDLRFTHTLPSHNYIQRLVEHFRESSPPQSMRRVIFSPEKILCEYVSASCHLSGAYVEVFPCQYCSYDDEEERTFFAEVFHFANAYKPNVCATVTFVTPVDTLLMKEPTECCIEVEVTEGCPNAPIVVVHSPRVVVHINHDVLIEGLCFLQRGELEKMQLVSRRWSNVIGWAEATLQQRRSFIVMPKFYGESSGMLSVHFARKVRSALWRILRVLPTRGLSHALNVVRSHLRNSFVDVLHFFLDRVPAPGPPREMLVDMPLPRRIDWLRSLLHSMPPNSEIRSWCVADYATGFDNARTLALCALKPHRKLGRVQNHELGRHDRDATWAHLASLLNQTRIRGFGDESLKLRVIVSGGIEPHDAILTLPAEIIRLGWDMPDVDEATNRRKRFRHHLQGEDIVVRVSVYENPTAREQLTVVTFDQFRGTVLILKGNVSLAEVKQALKRYYEFY